MFTINAYAFHPLAARFKMLWRHTQVVSGWIMFFVTWLCCPCMNGQPYELSSSPSNKPSSEACQVGVIKSKTDRVSDRLTPSLVQKKKSLGQNNNQFRQEAGDTVPNSPEFFHYVNSRSERELFVTSEDLELRENLDLESLYTVRPDRMLRDDCPSVHAVKSTSKKRSSASEVSEIKQTG